MFPPQDLDLVCMNNCMYHKERKRLVYLVHPVSRYLLPIVHSLLHYILCTSHLPHPLLINTLKTSLAATGVPQRYGHHGDRFPIATYRDDEVNMTNYVRWTEEPVV